MFWKKTGHSPAIEDALLKLHPEIRLHYSLYNREPHKAIVQSGSLNLKFHCIPSVSALIAHQHSPSVAQAFGSGTGGVVPKH